MTPLALDFGQPAAPVQPWVFPGCMLAATYEEGTFPVGGEWVAEEKMDGYRLQVVIDADGGCSYHCRDAKPVGWGGNVQFIGRQLVALGFRSCIVDGEIMGRKGWGATGIIRRKAPAEADVMAAVEFVAFDWIPLCGYERVATGRTQMKAFGWTASARREQLIGEGCRLTPTALAPNVRLVEQRRVTSEQELLAYRDEVVARGGEGVILKDNNAPYFFDRHIAWRKVVPMRTFDLKVLRVVEGAGKHKGRLGALVGETMDGRAVQVSAGTGFVDALREALWAVRDALPGMVFEVQARVSDVAVARHPVYRRFRTEKVSCAELDAALASVEVC